jgi:hypothetical protein
MPIQDHWPPGEPLPVQQVLQSKPNLTDLPKIPGQMTNAYGCPGLLYCLWKSGRHAAIATTCKRWSCKNCAKLKLDEITQIFSDATLDTPLVYDAIVKHSELNKICKLFRKKEISALSIKFPDDVYLIASDHVEARTWKMDSVSRPAAIAKLQAIDVRSVRRRDFMHNWKPESLYEPKKDTVVYSSMFSNMDDLRNIIGDYGVDIDSEFVDNPLDLVERMTKLRGDYTIVFDNVEYLIE